jgi:hypothetical protein
LALSRKNNCAAVSIAARRRLEQAIRTYISLTTGHAQPSVWTKTADEILASVS